MPIKVAHIPNLESEAFYYDMERRGIEFVNLEPNAVTGALERGEVDAGPVPVVDAPRLAERAAPVFGFCVASVTRATASILHSREPIETLTAGRVALGDADATSVALLRVLPFVFSRWMFSTSMERGDRVVLEDALFVGQEDWMNNLYKATGPRDDLFMLPREVLEYVQGLRFFIGVPEERAMTLFQEKLALLNDD